MDISALCSLTAALKENISKVIMGKEEQIEKILLCLYSGGHILLEDIPGTGKTTLAKALARSLDCGFKRIQFTPDLLPSELSGINYYNQKEQAFQFRPGAILPISCWRMRLTAPHLVLSPACWNVWRSANAR